MSSHLQKEEKKKICSCEAHCRCMEPNCTQPHYANCLKLWQSIHRTTPPIAVSGWEEVYNHLFPQTQKEATHFQDIPGKKDCQCFSCNSDVYRKEIKKFISSLLSLHTKEIKHGVENLVAIEIKKNHGTRMINSDDVLSLLDNQESKKK